MKEIITLAEQLKSDLTIAIAAEQLFIPAASDKQLMQSFELGWAAPAFDFLRNQLLLSEVMALSRLWDDNTDRVNVYSIPALAGRLSETGVVAKMIARERQLVEDIRQADMWFGKGERKVAFSAERQDADQREQELRTNLSSWLADVCSVKGRAEIARLRKHRHELLAHSAAPFRPSRVQPMRYGDPRNALQKTIPIVSRGFQLVTGIHHDFKTTASVWNDRQYDMWEMIRSAARGEKFSPRQTQDDLLRDMIEKGVDTISF